uniref:CASP-like protein n=1 Tax=Nelumbo nucifera TaxID=4432 RepID=A0A822YNG7_NELNU|nr:TPA_asm: hypothetical protein HUJ06_004780 [Nelumbo nucifera]
MDTNQAAACGRHSHSPHGGRKIFIAGQVVLRISATAIAVAATCLMATSKQSTDFFGIPIRAEYSYSPAFVFFLYANGIASVISLVSLFLVFVGHNKGSKTRNYFFLFLLDLIVMALVMGAAAAATAIGYVGVYGNAHTGWMPICDHVGKFCHRVTASFICSYLVLFVYLILIVLSAYKSGQTQ